MSEVKIFVTYYKNKSDAPIIKSDVYQPIMGGCASMSEPISKEFIRDDDGDNISNLNQRYGELTIHHWILKNYLPGAQERYLGICHYRRFLEFTGEVSLNLGKEPLFSPLHYIYYKYFIDQVVRQYTETNIMSVIKDYDVINTTKWFFNNKDNKIIFGYFHRSREMEFALKALERVNPEYMPYASEFLEDNTGYYCMCLVMKKELLKDYFEFEFNLLEEMAKDDSKNRWESYSSMPGYDEYHDIRMPAFIMERLYNVWLRYMVDKKKIKVLELPACKLVDPVDVRPEQRIWFLNKLSETESHIDPYYYDVFAARHPKLNSVIKLLVNKRRYNKLLGDPKSFFFDSSSYLIRFLGIFYK